MTDYKKGLTAEARELDSYLKNYFVLVRQKQVLEKRRKEIISDFNNPLTSLCLDGMPKGRGKTNDGCVGLPLKLNEVEMRIKEKIEEIKKEYQRIDDVIAFLPEDSKERLILEYRYIDRMSWEAICRIENMAKTPIIYLWRKGLYSLLRFAKIKKIVEDRQSEVRRTC